MSESVLAATRDLVADFPGIPPETCPLIDEVQDAIRTVTNTRGQRWRARRRPKFDTVEEMAEWVEVELYAVCDQLEKIRDANSALRDLGILWYRKALELADDFPEVEK